MTPAHVRQLIDALISLFDPVVQAIEDEDSAEALLKDWATKPPAESRFSTISPRCSENCSKLRTRPTTSSAAAPMPIRWRCSEA